MTAPSATAPASGVIRTDGADLYYERRGDGPPLLMIAGGGGDCGALADVAGVLAASHSVLTFDRRGNSRSRLHEAPAPITLAGQSDDALAVLRGNGFTSAAVFGTSGGAAVALDLTARHPGAVDAVVAHEPPLPAVLPDAGRYLAVYRDIERTLRDEGWQEALWQFQVRVGHVPPGQRAAAMAALLDPASILPPGPNLDLMARLAGNWEYMVRFEMLPCVHYRPDLESIAASRARIVLAAGTGTIAMSRRADLDVGDDPFHRPSLAITGALGAGRAEFAEFPGRHLAPLQQPGPFADRLRKVLAAR